MTPFDKTAYQKEYMRKRRADKKTQMLIEFYKQEKESFRTEWSEMFVALRNIKEITESSEFSDKEKVEKIMDMIPVISIQDSVVRYRKYLQLKEKMEEKAT